MPPNDETPDGAGTTDAVVVNNDNKPSNVPPSQGEDWEKRYKGLSATYTKLQAQFQKLTEDHEKLLGTREELEVNAKSVKAEIEKMKSDLDALTAEKEKLTQQLTTQEAKEVRTKLILSEYPDLAAFEAKGLLPAGATPEETKQLLDNFREALGSSVDQTLQKKVQGSGATAVGPTVAPKRSKEQIYAELTRLAGSRNPEDRVKYEALIVEWDDLNK